MYPPGREKTAEPTGPARPTPQPGARPKEDRQAPQEADRAQHKSAEPKSGQPAPASPAAEKPSAEKGDRASAEQKAEAKTAAAAAETEPAARPTTDGGEQLAVDAMLPPAAAQPVSEESTSKEPASGEVGAAEKAKVDSLLPPGVSAQPTPANRPLPVTTQQIESDTPIPSASTRSSEVIGVPTEDGGFIKLHEPVKKVEFAGEEIELHRLTPEERSRRRMFKNIIMLVVGLIALVGTAAILMMIFSR
jgi:hypothetical protein